MTVTMSNFLRNSLRADALVSGAAALLMAAGAPLLSPLLGLPSPLLVGAGLVLVPWTLLLLAIARRASVSRMLLIDVIAVNALWVAASVGLLVSGLVAPTALGIAFVAAQALTVALFAELQFMALRRAAATA